jgi:hypothetical protein
VFGLLLLSLYTNAQFPNPQIQGQYVQFDQVWGGIPSKYPLQGVDSIEYARLDLLYDSLRVALLSGADLYRLPTSLLAHLEDWSAHCDESGFLSKALLQRNGIFTGPNCGGQAARNQAPAERDENQTAPLAIKIWPNPADDLLHIAYPAAAQAGQVRLMDAQGRVVHQTVLFARAEQIAIPTAGLPIGLYVLETYIGGLVARHKVLIVR